LAKIATSQTDPKEVTQMVTDRKKDSAKTPAKQGAEGVAPEPNKINASTPYDFAGKNPTPYGGLLPVITMLEKLGFQALVEQTVTSKRFPRAMDLYRFVLGIVLGLTIGFPRLNQLRFIARDPILTGILKVTKLPVQSTFWRFVNALHRNVARQILTIMRTMRERVWAAANVKLAVVTIDTDTGVPSGPAHTLRPADGRTQKLQPQEQRQEKLPADAHVYRGNPGIRLGRIAQWRPPHGQTGRRSSAQRACGPTTRRDGLRPGWAQRAPRVLWPGSC
jgi:hypothetical protein